MGACVVAGWLGKVVHPILVQMTTPRVSQASMPIFHINVAMRDVVKVPWNTALGRSMCLFANYPSIVCTAGHLLSRQSLWCIHPRRPRKACKHCTGHKRSSSTRSLVLCELFRHLRSSFRRGCETHDASVHHAIQTTSHLHNRTFTTGSQPKGCQMGVLQGR